MIVTITVITSTYRLYVVENTGQVVIRVAMRKEKIYKI